MSKYFQEVAKKFSGDTELASKYMGVARQLLGGLKEMSSGLFQNSRSVLLPDGARISVSFAGAISQVAIDVRRVVSDGIERVCRPFLSGLLSVEQIGIYQRQKPDGETEDYEALEWLFPSAYQKLLTPSIDNKVAVEEFANPDLARSGFAYNLTPTTYNSVYAGSYSGSMRQAVQLLLGMAVELAGVYEHKFYGTHGLVRKYGYTDDKPEFWLVRMPKAGSSYGILAMNYPVCAAVTQPQKNSGVFWVPVAPLTFPAEADIAGAIESGSVFEVLPLSGIDLDGFSPLYDDCGWAFSISGHECSNILTKTVGSVPNVDYEVYTKRFTFSFTTTREKHGLSATLQAGEQSLFFTKRESGPRFPMENTVTVSLYPNLDSYQNTHLITGVSVDCPVHVFYKGDEAQVFNYVYDRSRETTTWNEGNYFNALHYILTEDWTACSGTYTGVTHAVGTNTIYYALNGARLNTYAHTGSESRNTFTVSLGGVHSTYTAVSGSLSDGFGGLYVVKNLGEVVVTDSASVSGAYTGSYQVLLVPFYQREGVYVLDAKRDVTAIHTNYPRGTVGMATTGEYWLLKSGGDYACGVGDTSVVIDQYTNVEACATPTQEYPDLPPASFFRLVYTGGAGYDALTGCDSAIRNGRTTPALYSDPPVVVPETIVWSGDMRFYGAGSVVTIPFGSSGGPETINPVKAKVLEVYSTDYITESNSLYIHAQIDGMQPDKHILYPVNTVDGAEATTNTGYPLAQMTHWGKSFVGIAN